MTFVIPDELQKLVDASVTNTLNGDVTRHDLIPLIEFIEADGMDEVLRIWQDEIAIEIDKLAAFCFDDASAVDYFDLESASDLTDSLRIEYAVDQVNRAVENSEGFCVSVHAFPLVAQDGKTAFLGFTLWTLGSLDESVTLTGLFQSVADFHSALESQGYWLFTPDFDQRAEKLLAKWQR